MSGSKSQSPSHRHHFIPQFLLREWAINDGKLISYWPRNESILNCKAYSPKGVAYEDWLYETTGFPPEHAQQMEDKFFKRIDDRASKAHRLLLDGRGDEMGQEMMSDWARFIMSIWFRTPPDIKGLGSIVRALASPEISERVIGMAAPDGFPEAALSELQMEAIRIAIDDSERGRALLNMEWATLNLAPTRSFLISDWPLDSAKNLPFLGHPRSYITMPISPQKLFIAAPSLAFVKAIGSLPERELERKHNYAIVAQARSFVGATGVRADSFIRRNFGCEGRPSIANALAHAWDVTI